MEVYAVIYDRGRLSVQQIENDQTKVLVKADGGYRPPRVNDIVSTSVFSGTVMYIGSKPNCEEHIKNEFPGQQHSHQR